MDDQTTIVVVAAGMLAAYVFMAAQKNMHKFNRQHSLGDMHRPAPREKMPPTDPN